MHFIKVNLSGQKKVNLVTVSGTLFDSGRYICIYYTHAHIHTWVKKQRSVGQSLVDITNTFQGKR